MSPRRKPDLTVVGRKVPAPLEHRADYHDYEAAHRARVASKNWADIHTRADRSKPITLPASWRAPR